MLTTTLGEPRALTTMSTYSHPVLLCFLMILINLSSYSGEMKKSSLVDTIDVLSSLKIFAQAVQRAEIRNILMEEGPFTIFAPSDDAFGNLLPETLHMLFQPENREELDALISSHVVPERFLSTDLVDGSIATALGGEDLLFSVHSGVLSVNTARVIRADILCTNGIIHIVDSVILGVD